MKITVIGGGSWGFCLAQHLARNEHNNVSLFVRKKELAKSLSKEKKHPLFPEIDVNENLSIFSLENPILESDLFVEASTASGFREVAGKIAPFSGYFAITSKGIELPAGKTLPQVALEVFGKADAKRIGILSGPGYAKEVIQGLPTSLVASGFSDEAIQTIQKAFQSPTFRVYPNRDIFGVALGGALKNVMAIACGIAEGLQLGVSARAAVMTRGLHEIRKLALALGCKQETLNGLSGMGDLFLTCSSLLSRNFRLGIFLAEGYSLDKAKEMIGTVTEGVLTAKAALALAKKYDIPLPITEVIDYILQGKVHPNEAISLLMQRTIKEESL